MGRARRGRGADGRGDSADRTAASPRPPSGPTGSSSRGCGQLPRSQAAGPAARPPFAAGHGHRRRSAGRGSHQARTDRRLRGLRRRWRDVRGADRLVAPRPRASRDALRARPHRRGLRPEWAGNRGPCARSRPDRLRGLRHRLPRCARCRRWARRRDRARPSSRRRDAAPGPRGREPEPAGRGRSALPSLRGRRRVPLPRGGEPPAPHRRHRHPGPHGHARSRRPSPRSPTSPRWSG